jgi:hypothetical protein
MNNNGPEKEKFFIAKEALISFVVFFGSLHLAHEYVFQRNNLCYCSLATYTALHFAVLSVAFSALLATLSFAPKFMRNVAEIYPCADGRGVWHARLYYRWSAASNLGYALVMLACGWVFPYGSNRVWENFGIVLAAGVSVMTICGVVTWKRHIPFRSVNVHTSARALSGVLFIGMFLVFLLAWAYWQFYFDFVATVVIFAISRIWAGLWLSVMHQIKFIKLKAQAAQISEA